MTVTFGIVIAILSLAAVVFAVWPLARSKKRLTPLIAAVIVVVVAIPAGLYYRQGSPEVPSGAGGLPDIDDMIVSLAARLEANPDDLNGWKMLGRSYMTMGNYDGAIDAFERAIVLESAQDPQTLVALGEALLAGTSGSISGRIASLFENALALDPNNPQALFYGGIGAFNRNDRLLAADRWESLLALNPPAEIQGILRQRIAEWRGQPVPVPMPAPQPASGVIVSAAISLADAAVASLPVEATVFVIARDPAQPTPPIAVTRRRLSELPATVEFSDRESMVPGRELSKFAEFELVARVSLSGRPTGESGDWYGAAIVRPADNNSVDLSIDRQLP